MQKKKRTKKWRSRNRAIQFTTIINKSVIENPEKHQNGKTKRWEESKTKKASEWDRRFVPPSSSSSLPFSDNSFRRCHLHRGCCPSCSSFSEVVAAAEEFSKRASSSPPRRNLSLGRAIGIPGDFGRSGKRSSKDSQSSKLRAQKLGSQNQK